MVTKTLSLSPSEVRAKRAQLVAEYQEARRIYEGTERNLLKIDRQIRELQADCPHAQTNNQAFQDGVEMKWRPICDDCGAEILRPFEFVAHQMVSDV